MAAGAVALPAVSLVASAQTYPTRPIRWIVPYPPGGGTDPIARLIGPFLSDRLGQPVIIENRPGAGANIGTEIVVKSPPDGYTLLFVSTANMINASLYRDLTFNVTRDIAPVAGLVRLPLVVVANPSVPARTIAELIDYAKTNHGRINFASAGVGTSNHLAGELFKSMTGVDFVHIPYRGTGPAITDLIGGQVQVIFDNLSTSIEHIRAGKLRALAVATVRRVDALPEVPTVAETVPGYEASSVHGVGVPAGTPTEVINVLNREINAALVDARIKSRLVDLTAIPIPMTAVEFRAEIGATTDKWAKVVRSSGAKLE